MEQITLESVNANVEALRQIVEEIKEQLFEDSLELSDEVVAEIKKSQNAPKSDFVSQEDVEAEFLK
jgi:hypothetical protein